MGTGAVKSPAQDPANKVDKFFYDYGWRGEAAKIVDPPTEEFVPGKKINVDGEGVGEILLESFNFKKI